MISKNILMDIIDSAKESTFIGIAISLTFMLATNGLPTNIFVWLHFILFGGLVGICIGTINTIIDLLFIRTFSDTIITTVFKLVLVYISSCSIFYLIGSWFYSSIELPKDYLLYTSLAIGIPSVMIALFFTLLDEKENKIQLEKENKELAIIQERNRIARELHDSVSQNLFGISLNLDTLKYSIEENPKQSIETIEQLQQMVQEVQTEMRLMIYELKPLSFQNQNFFEAIENLIHLFQKRYALKISSHLTGTENKLKNTTQLHLYRIIQESLNNIVKHAQADNVTINLEINNNYTSLKITDDGTGFDPDKINTDTQFGLQNIKERVNKINGDLEIDSSLGAGSTLIINTTTSANS